jgi:hypothetical protein
MGKGQIEIPLPFEPSPGAAEAALPMGSPCARAARGYFLLGRPTGERTGGPLPALRVWVGMAKGDNGFRLLNHEPRLSSPGPLCAVGVIPQRDAMCLRGGGGQLPEEKPHWLSDYLTLAFVTALGSLGCSRATALVRFCMPWHYPEPQPLQWCP